MLQSGVFQSFPRFAAIAEKGFNIFDLAVNPQTIEQ